MSDLLSSLPDQPLTRDAVKAIDGAEGVRRAISVTMKSPVGDIDAPDEMHTDDIIIITEDRVRYLSRTSGEGWTIERSEKYADDEEFEDVMDDVYDYAEEYSEEKIQGQVEGLTDS
ncbi:hypothetical protein [Halorussus sp. MSC15.2]|uniref:hypothetical protein n=1 Tax=Halorussus sp. MSC15.2 TaxID=2283638 RepID=UPI0013D78082|nr:hypothetical protein [Halorussus sp. MSC15.2]NEU56281.1 hypothetical protein [Halorussus sp. MSC15.2]